jgi:hypothetical protein
MSEENNHNDSLERFFRKKADDFDIPFREEDWMKLEKQLDIRDMKRSYRRKIAWITAAAILIISMLGYFTYENHHRLNEFADMMAREDAPQTEQPEVISPDALWLTESDEDQESDAVSDPEAEQSPVITQDELTRLLTEREEQFPRDRRLQEAVQVGHKEFVADLLLPMLPDDVQKTVESKMQTLFTIRDKTEPYGDFFLTDTYAKESADGLYPFDELAEAAIEPEYSRFALGFAVSPDLSTAGRLSDFYDPGYKIGVTGEYRISSNFSVSGGLIASNVRYLAGSGEYNPPGYWNEGVLPDETTAVCLILDIPLNLKYNVYNFERSRIFATAGLSSYIMLNEDYRFRYDEAGYGLEESISIRNGTHHLFSNAGFSVGYELDLHPNWSVRAEPFIRLPVRGVGWGDVNLYSMGSFISLNYRFSKW